MLDCFGNVCKSHRIQIGCILVHISREGNGVESRNPGLRDEEAAETDMTEEKANG